METFKENGSYNKTDWKIGDIITSERLNKIEDALYEINENSNDVNKLDLSNYVTKSEIPTNVSDFINDTGYVTQNHTHDNYITREEMSTVPTHVSQLINDAGYVTRSHTHNNYATKTYVDDAIANIDIPDTNNNNYITSNNITRIEVVTEYPFVEETGVLYIKVSE